MPRRFESPRRQERRNSDKTPRYPVGTVVTSTNPVTSKTEQLVMESLLAAGFSLHKGRSAIQCGLEPLKGNYPVLTPDILVSKSKVCVEVDPAYHHDGQAMFERDRLRNQLLADVGWTVVRLRLGGLAAIGEHDVLSDPANPTLPALAALAEAVEDAVAGRPGKIRQITKAPTTANKKSRLGAIAEHKYYENAHYVSWTADSGAVLRLVAVDNGRYLAQSTGFSFPRFIRLLHLEDTPRPKWRGPLEAILSAMAEPDFEPTSAFPWGDELFVGPQAGAMRLSEKFNPGHFHWELTANLEGLHSHTEVAFCDVDSVVLAELHPEAVSLGWQIHHVGARSGSRGSYQVVQLARSRPGL